MRKVKIAGFIATKNGVTLFMADGMPEGLSANDYRTQVLIEDMARNTLDKPGSIFETDLDGYSASAEINKANVGVKVEEKDGTTTVAVTNKETGVVKTIDVGSTLTTHMAEMSAGESAAGFGKFMERFSLHDCPQTSTEILDFMKRTDLPIADDGMIIAYKILRKTNEEGVYVDPHSGKVRQKVGSLVEQANTDPSKRNLCSTGLHVCYKDYAAGYGGDILTLIKIAPEDCIAHDSGQHKMRVRKYHICAILPDKAYASIRAGASARDTLGATVLEAVVAGDHPEIREHVLIKGAYGSDVEYTSVSVVVEKKVSKERRKARGGSGVSVSKVKDILKGKKANDNKPVKKSAKKAPVKVEPKSKGAKKLAEKTNAAVDKELKGRVEKLLKLHKGGHSIRAIAKEIHMDRDAIREWIDGTRKLAA